MAITARDVKRLREATGVGMMDCKRALEEAEGDFDRAVELLRKKGEKVAAKRADRDAREGVIVTAVADDASAAAIVEVNSETDFVARNDEFVSFAQSVADVALEERPETLEALLALDLDGRSVDDGVVDMTGKIGEKIAVSSYELVTADDNMAVVDYIHPGAKLGVVVAVSGNGDRASVGRDVAMQAAAMSPVAATRGEVPEETKLKELEIGREQARNEGKPDPIIERIAEGKLERFYKDHVLMEQPFVKDSSKTVSQMLSDADIELHRYVRFALGE